MAYELKLTTMSKGKAITELMSEEPFRRRVPVFAGDDVTDEDGFIAVTAMGGIALRVEDAFFGEPQTRSCLARRARSRRKEKPRHEADWILGSSAIARLRASSMRKPAMSGSASRGSTAIPLFNALVNGDEPEAGFMDVVLATRTARSQSYLRNTAILETILRCEGGSIRVTRLGAALQAAGADCSGRPCIMRRIEPVEGPLPRDGSRAADLRLWRDDAHR